MYEDRDYTHEELETLEKTTVYRSSESPTGYYVTFRYKDPGAARVRIFGEWKFSDKSDASFFTGTNAGPEQWKDGYTVWTTSDWPVADMKLNKANGVWSYTIPLPCGTWNYLFCVGGDTLSDVNDLTGSVFAYDPHNKPFMARELLDPPPLKAGPRGFMRGSEYYLTSLFVPWDPIKQAKSPHLEEQAPRKEQKGEVFFRKAAFAGKETYYGVYLPHGYDPGRAEKYPLLVLFHGGGGNEASWFNNGLANILDNMIAWGRMEPAIVVTPNGSDFPHPEYRWDRRVIMDYVISHLLPAMAENFNASSDPARRAIGGLSMGGATIMRGYFNNTETFGCYICMSAPMLKNVEPDFNKGDLKKVKLLFAFGMYDFICTKIFYDKDLSREESSAYDYLYGMGQAGVPFKIKMDLPYGHQWSLWREIAAYAFDSFLWK
jgi:S-formylglutathione hydrolase FrmB